MGKPIDRETLDALMDAGRSAVEFNAPMLAARSDAIAECIADRSYKAASPLVVDIGCGRGRLLHRVVRLTTNGRGLGLDTDNASLLVARNEATALGLTERLDFESTDATAWKGQCDVVICVGSSHIFGGSTETFEALATHQPNLAVVGIAMWETEPTTWCLEQFGEMAPGVECLAGQARAAGWSVEAASISTRDEWDGFEEAWIGGVRALGTDVAIAFADERWEAYQRYRGVLGFGWLTLLR